MVAFSEGERPPIAAAYSEAPRLLVAVPFSEGRRPLAGMVAAAAAWTGGRVMRY